MDLNGGQGRQEAGASLADGRIEPPRVAHPDDPAQWQPACAATLARETHASAPLPRNEKTGDPRTDPEIGGFVAEHFKTQPADWQTWHAQRIGGAMGEDERNAAARAAAHADTPSTAHFDTLGRPFLTVARNRVVCTGHDLDGTEDSFLTRVELDIEGNQRAVRDAIQQAGDPLGRIVMHYAYDMLGNRIHQLSMEAGARWMLNDVAGKPIRAWDSRGHNFTTTYDALRRPIGQHALGTTADSDPRTLNSPNSGGLLVDEVKYGEGVANAEALNLRTHIFRHFDSAGVATNSRLDAGGNPVEAYDFKGNLLRSTLCLSEVMRPRPAESIKASGRSAAFTGRTHDCKRPACTIQKNVLAKRGSSTHGPPLAGPLGRFS